MKLTALVTAAAVLLAAGAPAQDDPGAAADDPDAAVFVPDRCNGEEGAPPESNLGTLVLLTDLPPEDDYHAVVELLEEEKEPVATVRFPPGEIGRARAELLEHLPEFVVVVTRPERIHANLHFELLEAAAALDRDPFVDCAIGYVTGATAGEALAFTRRFLAVGRRRNALPESVFEFGPAKSGTLQEGGPIRHPLAEGWKKTWLYHGAAEEMRARAEDLVGHGVLHAGGHGQPDRVVDGLTARELRAFGLDLSPALYFSGPCYCGVTGSWFRLRNGRIERVEVDPMESFALAVLSSGVTALFAGLDPDRMEQSSQELEHLWTHGDALGHAMKATYDGTTLALRRPEYRLFRYREGEGRPQRNLAMTMIGGGAGRVLYGDPGYVPFAASAEPTFPVRMRRHGKGLLVEWRAREKPSGWLAIDVYRCGGRWTDRIALREEIPTKLARELRTFTVQELAADSGPLPGRFPTAMIERWGGKAFLHVYVVFEPGGLPRDVRDLRARFAFWR